MTSETWKMRDGNTIPVASLSDNHLMNIVRYLRRGAGSQRLARALMLDGHDFREGTIAAQTVEDEAERLCWMDDDEFLADVCPQWEALWEQIIKRRLPFD